MNALKDRAEAYLLEDMYEEGTLVCHWHILYVGIEVSISKVFLNMHFDSTLLSLISPGSCRFAKILGGNFVLISVSGMYLFYLQQSALYSSGLCSGCFMRLCSLLNSDVLYNQQCQRIAFRGKR